MRVRITTERDFPFEDIDKWIRHCISIGIPLDEEKLKKMDFVNLIVTMGIQERIQDMNWLKRIERTIRR